ncbi:guanylate kinase [Spiromyces aspiralis]|uniref:Guanylate kinase n=1 Tax=Spiromyces aspiralis TaxID=68401 RepID=A0ACC1HQK1_9FUNG|nr:guanylate kinase [Spiromyces aspiralis]
MSPAARSSTATKRLIVLFGPSGAGKSTLLKRLFKEYPNEFGFSVSHTTRQPRPGEVDGREYNFVTRDQFETAIANNEFIEYAQFSGNYYGTSVKAVKDALAKHPRCILDIDMQGVKSIKKTDLDASYVFVSPPSLAVLEERLRNRKTDSEDSIRKRLEAARAEIEFGNQLGSHDIKIVNDNLDEAYKKLSDFIFSKP